MSPANKGKEEGATEKGNQYQQHAHGANPSQILLVVRIVFVFVPTVQKAVDAYECTH